LLWKWQSRFWRETGGRARANQTLDGSCSFTFSATSLRPAPTAASGSLNVLAENACGWTAASDSSWLTITSGVSGSGNGTLNYNIAANASANNRVGTITIAGQPFTVTQLGAAKRRAVGR
jgi:hypothetical protein